MDDLKATIDPGKDAIVRKLPPDKVKAYLKITGCRLSYSGGSEPRYYSELLYYIDEDGNIITGELNPGELLNLS